MGIIGCAALLIAADKSEKKVIKLERDLHNNEWDRDFLKKNIDSGTATKSEEQAYIKLTAKLGRYKKDRKLANYIVGYFSIYLTLGYLGLKQYLIYHDQNLVINDELINLSFCQNGLLKAFLVLYNITLVPTCYPMPTIHKSSNPDEIHVYDKAYWWAKTP